MRRFAALACATVAILALVAGPAAAAPGDTTTTFSITAGSLSISVPSSANLGSVATGASSLSGQLGSVGVTDTRGALVATWTATVSTTVFTTGGATANETVAKSAIAYSSGTASTTGTGAFTPGVLATMSSAGTAGSWAGVGNDTASWNPTFVMTLLSSQVAGTYSGTVNHSVA